MKFKEILENEKIDKNDVNLVKYLKNYYRDEIISIKNDIKNNKIVVSDGKDIFEVKKSGWYIMDNSKGGIFNVEDFYKDKNEAEEDGYDDDSIHKFDERNLMFFYKDEKTKNIESITLKFLRNFPSSFGL